MRYHEIREDISSAPEFKRWFVGSKVVDAKGQPLRMYHGTSHAHIQQFDVGYNSSGHKNWEGNHKVISFTSDPDFAEGYAGGIIPSIPDRRPTIYPVYIRATNPGDFRNPEHVKLVKELYMTGTKRNYLRNQLKYPDIWTPEKIEQYLTRESLHLDEQLKHGSWTQWENPAMWKKFGWDGAWSREEPQHRNAHILNFAIADGRQAKAAYVSL